MLRSVLSPKDYFPIIGEVTEECILLEEGEGKALGYDFVLPVVVHEGSGEVCFKAAALALKQIGIAFQKCILDLRV